MRAPTLEKKAATEAAPSTIERTRPGRLLTPLVDIYETADGLMLEADLPGAAADSIEVNFENGELSLEAKGKPAAERPGNLLFEELEAGSYFRSFRVSEAIDASRISAAYRNGVLTLHLPKVEAVKPRRIQVTSR